jgi:selenide,water dikinase
MSPRRAPGARTRPAARVDGAMSDASTGSPVALTRLARGAGCGCKLGKDVLLEALAGLPSVPDDARVLVGPEGLDDGCAYLVRDDLALVASVDFFTPVVDDPRTFGAIAATNALSDLYAMGATPTLALAVCAYPKEGDRAALGAILAGGAEAALAQGCPVLGGHSIDDPEPKYGLAVVGTAHPERLLTNAAGRPGDALVLTKPLGVGIVATARAAGAAAREACAAAEASMLEPNRAASEGALAAGLRCATDVTGYGLLGHLHELAAASGVGAEVDAAAVPRLPGVAALAAAGHVSGGLRRNLRACGPVADIDPGLPEADRLLLHDPQTSGGLLLAAPPDRLDDLARELGARGVAAWTIGRLTDEAPGRIAVVAPVRP